MTGCLAVSGSVGGVMFSGRRWASCSPGARGPLPLPGRIPHGRPAPWETGTCLLFPRLFLPSLLLLPLRFLFLVSSCFLEKSLKKSPFCVSCARRVACSSLSQSPANGNGILMIPWWLACAEQGWCRTWRLGWSQPSYTQSSSLTAKPRCY